MRLNKYLALATGMSRRTADAHIAEQRVRINDALATLGQEVDPNDKVTLDGKLIVQAAQLTTIMLNKPVGYVCSRNGQGNSTIYNLLPSKYHHLKLVGRLDKDSSGLLLLTNDGQLTHSLTHPSSQKEKIYEIKLDKPLTLGDTARIEQGVTLEDGPSKLALRPLDKTGHAWQVTMHEGRNRQIRRTFAATGYQVQKLHRTKFGPHFLGNLTVGNHIKQT